MESSSESDSESNSEGSYDLNDDIDSVGVGYGIISYNENGLGWQLQSIHQEFSSASEILHKEKHQVTADQVLKSLFRRILKSALYRCLILAATIFILYSIYQAIKPHKNGFAAHMAHQGNKREKGSRDHFSNGPYFTTSSVRSVYKILAWNVPNTVHIPEQLQEKCGPCVVTTDRKVVRTSHAIVIHFRDTARLPDPETRSSDQVYVWLCRESPWSTKNGYERYFSAFDSYFNATMTHRRDSEIFYPYAESLVRANKAVSFYQSKIEEIIAKKRYLAAWVVSNCFKTKGAEHRFWHINHLKRAGLKVDFYGGCFRNSSFPPYRSDEATERLSQYKFYLAFENSLHCRDYITEKFWFNALYSGAVPIVWGPTKDDLKELAPPNSYINAEDFKSNEELVEYINYLDKNDEAYKQYFQWRKGLSSVTQQDGKVGWSDVSSNRIFSPNASFGFCALCHALHTGRAKTFKSIPSIDNWWYHTENSECLS